MNTLETAPSQISAKQHEHASSVKAKQARKRSVKVKSSVPSGSTSTPEAMKPANARDAGPLAPKSTPKELDYFATVRDVMLIQQKSGLGFRLVSNKSKNHVFALACDAVRSHYGIDKFDGEGKLIPLDEERVKLVKVALTNVWETELNRLLSYGGPIEQSDMRIQWDAPMTKPYVVANADGKPVIENGKEKRDLQVRLSATARVTRGPKDISEEILVVSIRTTAAKKKLDYIQKNPGRYGTDYAKVYRETHDLVTIHEWKLGQLNAEKTRLSRIAEGVSALDALLAKGTISQAEYDAKRTEIETAK